MPLSLYDITVPSFTQQLGAIAGLIDKAEAHCKDHGWPESALVGARLIDDMHPFSYQVKSTVVHSVGALRALPSGVFSPDTTPPPETFAALRQRVAEALDALAAFTPPEVNGHEGRDMAFVMKDIRRPFTAENFLLSFSLPNFYFHAATAYDILRHKGVVIGKRDFLGRQRIKA